MPENELIVRHKGKSYDIDLTERDADRISNLTAVLEHAPRDPERTSMGGEPRNKDWGRRLDERRLAAGEFQAPLQRLANLTEEEMIHVMALLDLMELGNLDGSHNWALEFIQTILYDVVRFGSAASALHQDPRGILADLSDHMYDYWAWVRDSRNVVTAHPELFSTPPTQAAEPAPAAEPPVTTKAAKPGRTRKMRRTAA